MKHDKDLPSPTQGAKNAICKTFQSNSGYRGFSNFARSGKIYRRYLGDSRGRGFGGFTIIV